MSQGKNKGQWVDRQKQVELALRACENRYRALFDQSHDAVFIIDLNGRHLEANACVAELLGYSLDEIQSLSYKDLSCEVEDSERVLKKLLNGEHIPLFQRLFRKKNGEIISVEINVELVRDHNGRPLHIQSVVRDITKRKQEEQLLEQSREWYRTLAEGIPAFVCRLSPVENFTYANDAYCRFIGINLDDLIEQNIYQFIPPQYSMELNKALTSLTPLKATATHEHINIDANGRCQWVKWTYRALFGPDNRLKEYLCIGENITEQKRVFNNLQDSELLKSFIIKAIPDTLIRYNNEGRCLEILTKDEGKLKLFPEQMLNRTVYEVFSAGLAEQIMACLKKTLQTGKLQRLVYSLDTPSGTRDFEGRFKAYRDNEIIAVMRDISEEKRIENALRKSEEKYREIIVSIEEGYCESDLAGNINFCNDAACRLSGYNREELLEMNYKQLFKNPETTYQRFLDIYLSGQPERGLTLEIIRKDGTIFFGELSVSLIKGEDGKAKGFRGVVRDISERIRFEERLRFFSLHDQLTGIYNRTYFEEELKRLSSSRDYPITMISADLDGLKLINDTLGHDKGDQQLIACAQVLQQSLRASDMLARVGGDEFSTILPHTDKETGSIIVSRIKVNVARYNRKHKNLPLVLSLGVATAESKDISFVELYKQADDMMYRDKHSRSAISREKIVQTLLATLAERDIITEGHARRLAERCRKTGEEINLSSERLIDLELLARVHDLGKVGIPDQILFNTGPLSEEEWVSMKQHSEKGYRIAVSSPDLSGVADLILKHHEHWDGTGYPLGLKGEEIPVECRILAIADAYDAMTSRRPYRQAMDRDEAILELKKYAGTQFDPELVEAFLIIIKEEEEGAIK